MPLPLFASYARKELISCLASIEHYRGKATANAIAEANLQAIAIYLKGSIGPHAAFDILTKQAEEIIRPELEAGAKRR
jgi:hypothetical protein